MRVPTPRALYEYYQRIPTTDLYFRNPVRHLRGEQRSLPPIRHIRANIYVIGRTGVISRYATVEDLALLEKQGVRQIVYVADDDFEAGAADRSLPERYRARLAEFVATSWPAIVAAAEIIVVSSPLLAGAYGAKARLLTPLWHAPPADTRHFENPKRFEVAHLGSGSHRADLLPLTTEIAKVLGRHPQARLTLFAASDLPPPLTPGDQIRTRRPMPWWAFKRLLPRMRFHLAIYPLADGPFNAARSANKLYEHALAGAASLMSPNAALRVAAGQDLADIFVGGVAGEWRRRIEADIADPQAVRERAERTRAHILATDPAGEATRQWLAILAGES